MNQTAPILPDALLSCVPELATLNQSVEVRVEFRNGVLEINRIPNTLRYSCFHTNGSMVSYGLASAVPARQCPIFIGRLLIDNGFSDGLHIVECEFDEFRMQASFCVVRNASVLTSAPQALEHRDAATAAIKRGEYER